ncbi:hypothetical protein ACFQZX_06280 [Mucilaginibacter litoreus]|uniref:Uncharacterized protein n=1 Tax=Mucilaginibacter litoreus TaxID=1048221 RepID=A0ABW3AQB3_9SPHI
MNNLPKTQSLSKAKAHKAVLIASKVAPIISGLTESEFDDVFNLLKRSILETKNPIAINFVPGIEKLKAKMSL